MIMQLSVLTSGVEGDVPPEDDAIFEQPSENPCHDLVHVLDRWKSILEYAQHITREERCNNALDEARAFCCENLSLAIRNLDFAPTDFQSIPQHLHPDALKSGICTVNNDDNQEVWQCDKNIDRMNQQRCNYALHEARAFCCENLSLTIRNLTFGPTDFQITLILIFIVVGVSSFLVFASLRLMELIDDYWFSWKKYQHSNLVGDCGDMKTEIGQMKRVHFITNEHDENGPDGASPRNCHTETVWNDDTTPTDEGPYLSTTK